MPKKSDVVRLRHMLDASEKALRFTTGRDRVELDVDEKLALSRELALLLKGEGGDP